MHALHPPDFEEPRSSGDGRLNSVCAVEKKAIFASENRSCPLVFRSFVRSALPHSNSNTTSVLPPSMIRSGRRGRLLLSPPPQPFSRWPCGGHRRKEGGEQNSCEDDEENAEPTDRLSWCGPGRTLEGDAERECPAS